MMQIFLFQYKNKRLFKIKDINKIQQRFSASNLLMIFILMFFSCTKDLHDTAGHYEHYEPPFTDTTNTEIIDHEIQPGHLLYVADEKSGSISVLKPSQGKRIRSIPLSPPNAGLDMLMPHNIQVAPDGKSVWVTAVPMKPGGMEQLIVINPLTNNIIKRIDVGKSLHLAHVVFDDKSENLFFTATDADMLIQFNSKTFQEIRRFQLSKESKPHGLRYYNNKLYIANTAAKTLGIIDVTNGNISEIALGGMAMQTAVTQNGKYVFVSLFDTREIIRYDVQNQMIVRISLPQSSQGPMQLYPTPDSKKLFVCDQGVLEGRPVSDEVYVIDINEAKVLSILKSGRGAHGVVISNDGKTAYVTNSGEQSVSIIDVATQKLKSKIAVGAAPNGISYWFESGGMP